MKRRVAVAVVLVLLIGLQVYPQSEVRTFTVATGEVMVFPFEGGVPKPSESEWTICRGAGPAIQPDGDGYRLNWVVDLQAKKSQAALVRNVAWVTLQEVSGRRAVPLFSGKADVTEDGLLVVAPAQLVTRATYPWLYSASPTLLIFRVEFKSAEAKRDVLFQPVLIGPEVKMHLKKQGYLP